MTKYIDAEKLKEKIDEIRHNWLDDSTGLEVGEYGAELGAAESILDSIDDVINSLQQEPTFGTDVLYTKLVNLLKTYRIGEETAITLADRIADTYGAQRYIDGLCDRMDKEDIKMDQPEVDLEKEVHNYLKTHHLHIKDGGRVVFDNDDSPNFMCDIRDIARHFYELGLNARKQ